MQNYPNFATSMYSRLFETCQETLSELRENQQSPSWSFGLLDGGKRHPSELDNRIAMTGQACKDALDLIKTSTTGLSRYLNLMFCVQRDDVAAILKRISRTDVGEKLIGYRALADYIKNEYRDLNLAVIGKQSSKRRTVSIKISS